MYLDYSQYTGMGGQLEETVFNRYEFKARRYLDAVTHNRICNESPVRECVQRAMFELIELFVQQAETDAKAAAGISSEHNDGVSRTYTSAASVNRHWNTRKKNVLTEYLADELDAEGVPLLYAGVEFDGGDRS